MKIGRFSLSWPLDWMDPFQPLPGEAWMSFDATGCQKGRPDATARRGLPKAQNLRVRTRLFRGMRFPAFMSALSLRLLVLFLSATGAGFLPAA